VLYNSIIATKANYEQWKQASLATGIFFTEDEAASYLMKYMVRDYVYLGSALKKMFSRGAYDLQRLYRFGYEDMLQCLNMSVSQMVSVTYMDFLLSEPNSYSILIEFPSFKGYSDANVSDLLNSDGTPKYLNDMLYCVARDFLILPNNRKQLVIDNLIQDMLRYCTGVKRRRFSKSLLYYVILQFLGYISSSLDQDTNTNIIALNSRYSQILLNELKCFYNLYNMVMISTMTPFYENLLNLDETRLSNWFTNISASKFSSVVPYLQYDENATYTNPIPDPTVSDVLLATPTDPNA
jgi:hypothetical protein